MEAYLEFSRNLQAANCEMFSDIWDMVYPFVFVSCIVALVVSIVLFVRTFKK